MNKLVTMIAAAASLVVASVASTTAVNAGAVLDKVLETKTLTVAVGTDWGKMSFLNDKHELDGYDVQVAKGVAEYLGVKVEFVTPSWDIITSGKWEGRWDITMGQMTPTNARAEKFHFPAIYFYERAVAVVHKGSKASKPSDLDGKVVGVAAGSIFESYATHTFMPNWVGVQPIQYQFKPGQAKTYATTNVAFDDLRLGDGVRLDGVVTAGTIADNAIKSGYPLKVVGDPLFSSPAVIPVLHGDKEFSDKIAAAIKKMKDDGTLSKLSMKWYGADYTTEK
ncbi:transporter substrate-binding domain-containing protein [Mesorhizobium sp.]|uniref:transporter substrate-binding domain-containing protein n=1 Tax=Mesorhizobium sp. TaxID=1871066 RepID=UPI001207F760|nr:transporter substrate-binding domain-containing protein [Mesorhizobium sp.]TIO30517.1 MAG: transporter substrate-binding domain-containing protein [Mesorhizobium sp.]TIQ03054.1 MAG: transporter substrate-binding domain-containing protein [Mesorhizobium sp.]